jgi:hypothetical protein
MADIYFYEMDEIPERGQRMMQAQRMIRPQRMCNSQRYSHSMGCNDSGGKSAAVCILIILIIIIIIIIIYVFCTNNCNNYYGYKNGFLASPEAVRDFNKVKSMDPNLPYTEFKLNIPNYDAAKHQHIKQKLTNNTLTPDDFDNT